MSVLANLHCPDKQLKQVCDPVHGDASALAADLVDRIYATQVMRPTKVPIRWTDLDGGGYAERQSGFAARCGQHQVDHLNRLVVVGRLSPAQCDQMERDHAR